MTDYEAKLWNIHHYKSLWEISDDTRKNHSAKNFLIKRTKYNEWYIFRNGSKFKKEPIDEYDIDNQIGDIKNILRIQRCVKSQDIEVIKDMDNGLINIRVKENSIIKESSTKKRKVKSPKEYA